MYFSKETMELAKRVVQDLSAAGMTLATAESCTGGLIAAAVTEISGASAVLMGGFVAYDNRVKQELLGVDGALFGPGGPGAVSPETARAMAEGARRRAGVDIAVAATGIAGPGGGTVAKPVGLVHLAAARECRETLLERHVFLGGRDAVRAEAVTAALKLVLRCLDERA